MDAEQINKDTVAAGLNLGAFLRPFNKCSFALDLSRLRRG